MPTTEVVSQRVLSFKRAQPSKKSCEQSCGKGQHTTDSHRRASKSNTSHNTKSTVEGGSDATHPNHQ